MSRLAALWKRKFVFLALFVVVFLCVLLSPGRKSAAQYCLDAENAQRNYQKTMADDNIDRASGSYIPVSEQEDMQMREETRAQIAEVAEHVCEDQKRMEADDAELADLGTRFDVSRFSSYTKEQRLAVLKAAGLVDTLEQPPSLSSDAGKLALLRAFRDHPELYH